MDHGRRIGLKDEMALCVVQRCDYGKYNVLKEISKSLGVLTLEIRPNSLIT